jgi:hypothetical protein
MPWAHVGRQDRGRSHRRALLRCKSEATFVHNWQKTEWPEGMVDVVELAVHQIFRVAVAPHVRFIVVRSDAGES